MERTYINEKEELERLLKENECLLYCAGRVTRNILKFLAKADIKVNGILVTSIQGNPKEIMGIPVFEINECYDDAVKKCIIVSAMENIHDEIQQELSKHRISRILYISEKLYHNIEYSNSDYEIETLYQVSRLKDAVSELDKMVSSIEKSTHALTQQMLLEKKRILKFIPRPCLEYLVVNILDHCNLRCKGCDHFACIADPYFVSVETIKKDVEKLAQILHGDNVIKIAVMGGEPLLHPDLLEILKIVRRNFPYTIIRLTTNGILLLKQKDEFWKVCREYKISIVNTKYPINLDFDGMKKKAISENVKFQYFEDTGDEIVKTSFKKIINLEGNNNPVESFSNCHISNYGNFLMEGKFFSCPFSCQSNRIFNKKFNQNLRLTESDYLDIYKVKDMQEIFEFAARPKYYCRYCCGVTRGFDWTQSKKQISEWVDE